MNIDYTTLERAIQRLQEALDKYFKYQNDKELGDTVRDSLVQRFEFVYEHSMKLLARCLKNLGYEKIDANNKKSLWRTAYKTGHINNIDNWIEYRAYRNQTSHEYNEELVISEEFIKITERLYRDSQGLLNKMQEIKL